MPANNLLQIDFYKIESDTTKIETTVDSLTMIIVGREDSILYDNSKAVTSISIPLSDSLNFLKIILKINDAVDTLYLDYRPYSVFRSTECGVINRYEFLKMDITKNRIIGFSKENENIDENEAVNLFMYVDLN